MIYVIICADSRRSSCAKRHVLPSKFTSDGLLAAAWHRFFHKCNAYQALRFARGDICFRCRSLLLASSTTSEHSHGTNALRCTSSPAASLEGRAICQPSYRRVCVLFRHISIGVAHQCVRGLPCPIFGGHGALLSLCSRSLEHCQARLSAYLKTFANPLL